MMEQTTKRPDSVDFQLKQWRKRWQKYRDHAEPDAEMRALQHIDTLLDLRLAAHEETKEAEH